MSRKFKKRYPGSQLKISRRFLTAKGYDTQVIWVQDNDIFGEEWSHHYPSVLALIDEASGPPKGTPPRKKAPVQLSISSGDSVTTSVVNTRPVAAPAAPVPTRGTRTDIEPALRQILAHKIEPQAPVVESVKKVDFTASTEPSSPTVAVMSSRQDELTIIPPVKEKEFVDVKKLTVKLQLEGRESLLVMCEEVGIPVNYKIKRLKKDELISKLVKNAVKRVHGE